MPKATLAVEYQNLRHGIQARCSTELNESRCCSLFVIRSLLLKKNSSFRTLLYSVTSVGLPIASAEQDSLPPGRTAVSDCVRMQKRAIAQMG